MRFKIILLLPLIFSSVSCSSSDKIEFYSGSQTFETYYNDNYFLKNNADMHQEIALASHAMALTTFNGDEDYSKRGAYLIDLWNKEGFENIYLNDSMKEKPGTDTIGYGIASKSLYNFGGSYTLIAIAVRGGNYGAEWTSNLTIGLEGNAVGFDMASNEVIAGLTNFVNNYDIKGNLKIWISGYSRAAITSNMVAGKLLNSYEEGKMFSDNISYTDNDIYAYCFEPPMGVEIGLDVARKELYKGIHNFLNYNDLVPLVAPYEWGFVRYGTDHYYPDRLNDIYFDYSEREKLISLYHFANGAENFAKYTVDKWKFFDVGEIVAAKNNLPRESVHPSQGRFLRAFIHELAIRGFKDRETYYYTVQPGMREIIEAVMGLNDEIAPIEVESIIKVIFEYDFIKDLIMELEQDQSGQFAIDMQLLFYQIFGANKDNIDAVNMLYQHNFMFFAMLALSFGVRKDIMSQLLYRDNAMGIAIGHMPELSYVFLSACDTRVMGNDACKFNDGSYDILHIDEPTSFSLLEKNIKKEVFSYKDGKMSSDYLSAEKFADGSIDIYLPTNGQYEYICASNGISLTHLDPITGESLVNDSLPSNGEL